MNCKKIGESIRYFFKFIVYVAIMLCILFVMPAVQAEDTQLTEEVEQKSQTDQENAAEEKSNIAD